MANKRLRKELVESMQALEDAGVVFSSTMRDLKKEFINPPTVYSAKQIRKLRENFDVSQGVFAALLSVSASTVQKWEQGKKSPSAPACKLLDIIKNHGLSILL